MCTTLRTSVGRTHGLWVIAFATATTVWTQPTIGQESFVSRSYQRIRITASQLGHYDLTGRLVEVGQVGLRMRAYNLNYELVIPLGMLDRFEVSRGRNKAFTIGAPLVGLGLGALLGPMVFTETERCSAVGEIAVECRKVMSDAVVGALAGFGFFAITSQVLVPERWREILTTEIAWNRPMPGALTGGAIRVGLQLRF